MATHAQCKKLALMYPCGGSVLVYANCMANPVKSRPNPNLSHDYGMNVERGLKAARKHGRAIAAEARKLCRKPKIGGRRRRSRR